MPILIGIAVLLLLSEDKGSSSHTPPPAPPPPPGANLGDLFGQFVGGVIRGAVSKYGNGDSFSANGSTGGTSGGSSSSTTSTV